MTEPAPESSPTPETESSGTYRLSSHPEAWRPEETPVGAAGVSTASTSTSASGWSGRTRGRSRGREVSTWDDWWALLGCNLLLFLVSGCVMTIELTASRLMCRHVGSSLYTWTSVIGVILAGITLGNIAGGWLADRFERKRMLGWMLLAASVTCASVLWLDRLAVDWERPASLSWPTWVLTMVGLIFFSPAFALGTTSPLIAAIALSRGGRMGQILGNVYAWGAFGSIAGTFLTGFYLTDMWGTRAIIGFTSGMLGVLAAVVAWSRAGFRNGVVLGWLQFLGGLSLLSAASEGTFAVAGEYVGRVVTIFRSAEVAKEKRAAYRETGEQIGRRVHEIGLACYLRRDVPGRYDDESAYYAISVEDSAETDSLRRDRAKTLRLNTLAHSYYSLDDPLRLYYEYEQIYAAVTLRVADAMQPTGVTVDVPDFPGAEVLLAKLPVETSFDATTRKLTVNQLTPERLAALEELSPDHRWWRLLEEARLQTARTAWGGYLLLPIDALPEGVEIPEEQSGRMRYDTVLHAMTFYDVVSTEDRDRLINATKTAQWHQVLQQLRRARAISALSLGGGGYVFPRWLLAQFPGSTRLDVAELDPAVLAAVKAELGFTEEDEQRIHTTLGDARIFVKDRIRENQRRRARQEPPITYDFIYGDAFSDFSIPAHLTTVEFLTQLRDLLTERGLLQANIIEIYPREEYPVGTVGTGQTTLQGRPPEGLFDTIAPPPQKRSFNPDSQPPRTAAGPQRVVKPAFKKLEAVNLPNQTTRLVIREPLTPAELDALRALDPRDNAWLAALEDLVHQSQTRLPFGGQLPAAIAPSDALRPAWNAAPAPWDFVELLPNGDHVTLGFRGFISRATERKLIDLDAMNTDWVMAVQSAARRSRQPGPGRFLGRYVATAAKVFPCVYLFSTAHTLHPDSDRDTFIMICSKQPVDLRTLPIAENWVASPFAAQETVEGSDQPVYQGLFASILEAAEGAILTDDFAPVDNLLAPVFRDKD